MAFKRMLSHHGTSQKILLKIKTKTKTYCEKKKKRNFNIQFNPLAVSSPFCRGASCGNYRQKALLTVKGLKYFKKKEVLSSW